MPVFHRFINCLSVCVSSCLSVCPPVFGDISGSLPDSDGAHWEQSRTMNQYGKKHRKFSRIIIHFPTSEGVSEVNERASKQSEQWRASKRSGASERSGARERSQQCGSKWVSGANKRANGWASGPILNVWILDFLAHSVALEPVSLTKKIMTTWINGVISWNISRLDSKMRGWEMRPLSRERDR